MLQKNHSTDKKNVKAQLKKSLSKQHNEFILATLGNIPGITKSSSWDELNDVWVGTNAQRQIVNNNQIVLNYFLSYNLTDTFSRVSYTYDNQGRYLSSLSESRDIMGNYVPQSRVNFTYSTNGLSQTAIIERYDLQTNTWVFDTKILNEKNDRGAATRDIYYYYNNNAWEISFGYSSKITYLNSTSSKTTEEIDSTFDFNTKTMRANIKTTQVFDANDRAVDVKFYEEDFSTGNLLLTTQDSIFYDANGLPNLLIEKEVDAAGNANDVLKYTDIVWFSYDPNKNIFENSQPNFTIYYKLGSIWLLAGRSSTTYPDNNGSMISLQEVFNAGVYVPDNKRTLLYNSNKDIIQDTEESYDDVAGMWNYTYGNKYVATYDANNNKSEYITQNLNTNTNAFVNYDKKEFSDYVLVNTGITTNKKDDFIVYPNPVTVNELNIKHKNQTNHVATVSIYDVNGKKLKEINLIMNGSNSSIQLDNIESGIYLVKFETNNETTYSKFIKE
ncbi:MAG: T9SS type A sorting domain-containing protein [bacterium]